MDTGTLADRRAGVAALLAATVCERLSFYTMLSAILVFASRHLPENQAEVLYLSFTILAQVAMVPGGLLADRWLGHRPAAMVGAACSGLGMLALLLVPPYGLYLGTSLIALGGGLVRPGLYACASTMLAPTARERAVFWLAVATSLGAFFGGLSSGYLDLPWPFVAAAAFSFAAALILARSEAALAPVDHHPERPPAHELGAPLVTLILPALILAVCAGILSLRVGALHPERFALLAGAAWMLFALTRRPLGEREELMAVFRLQPVLGLVVALYLLLGSSPRTGFLPASSILLTAIELLVPLAIAGVLIYWRGPSTATKLVIGLAMIGLPIVAQWLSLLPSTDLGHGLGALSTSVGLTLIWVTSFSLVTRLAPPTLLATCIGTWYVAIALGGRLAPWLLEFTAGPVLLATALLLFTPTVRGRLNRLVP
jgi:dipeptide/tripeptide permease